jgi:hypothetical protein
MEPGPHKQFMKYKAHIEKDEEQNGCGYKDKLFAHGSSSNG